MSLEPVQRPSAEAMNVSRMIARVRMLDELSRQVHSLHGSSPVQGVGLIAGEPNYAEGASELGLGMGREDAEGDTVMM